MVPRATKALERVLDKDTPKRQFLPKRHSDHCTQSRLEGHRDGHCIPADSWQERTEKLSGAEREQERGEQPLEQKSDDAATCVGPPLPVEREPVSG